MCPECHRYQEIEGTAIRMGQRKETQLAFAPEQDIKRTGIRHITGQIVSRQHHSLAKAGRAGSIIQQDHFIIVQISISRLSSSFKSF